MWDKDVAARYEKWFATPAGAYALGREIRLIEHMTSGWPRRGQRLVEVGCGTGIFLEAMHRGGFEVTGLDKSPDMLAAASARLGGRADLHLGDAEHLPFSDNEFDYCLLLTVLEFLPDPGLAVREAARVARKGILVGFLNAFSLHRLEVAVFSRKSSYSLLKKAHWFTPWALRRLIAAEIGQRVCRTRTVLPGPSRTWRAAAPYNVLNRHILSLPIGAYGALRVDLLAEPGLTPLHAWSAKPEAG